MSTIADLTPAVVRLCGNRTDVAAIVPEHMGKAITELSDNYPFEELRVTGPTVQLIPGQNAYLPSFFQVPAVAGNPYTLNKIISWWLYLSTPVNFTNSPYAGSSGNSGYNLKFKDIEDCEVLANILTLPQFWSWLGADLYLVATPNSAYYTYIRYQFKHPFSSPVAVSTDPVLLPSTWNDIIEIATAERVALDLRMQDVADRMHMKLFGDPKKPRDLGLIAARTSQTQKNQARTTRGIQVQKARY